jgi:hypothetical protein
MNILEAIILSLPTTLGLLFLKGVQSYSWMVWIRWPMKDDSSISVPAGYIAIFAFLSGVALLVAYLLGKKAYFYVAVLVFIGVSFIADEMTWGIRMGPGFAYLWGFQIVVGIGSILVGLSSKKFAISANDL